MDMSKTKTKTELILSTTKSHVKEISNWHLSFDGTIVSNGSVVKNLSVYFDRTLSMEKQVNAVTVLLLPN